MPLHPVLLGKLNAALDGFEVDFHSRRSTGEVELIQVCADTTDAETAMRKLRALESAAALYPRASRRLLTLNRDRIPVEVPKGILVQTVYEWILAASQTPGHP